MLSPVATRARIGGFSFDTLVLLPNGHTTLPLPSRGAVGCLIKGLVEGGTEVLLGHCRQFVLFARNSETLFVRGVASEGLPGRGSDGTLSSHVRPCLILVAYCSMHEGKRTSRILRFPLAFYDKSTSRIKIPRPFLSLLKQSITMAISDVLSPEVDPLFFEARMEVFSVIECPPSL